MKLEHLTPNELEAYNNWNLADDQGGDCQGIGYAWAAFNGFCDADHEGIILTEDSDGFVAASTFHGLSNAEAYSEIVQNLERADDEYEYEYYEAAREEGENCHCKYCVKDI
jgi:hypothetical protein